LRAEDVLRLGRSHCLQYRFGGVVLAPTLHDAEAVASVFVLVEFGDTGEALDVDFNVDDGGQHAVNIFGLGVAHFSRLLLSRAGFVGTYQAGRHPAQEFFIVANAQLAVHMHYLIISGQHLPLEFVFARIAARSSGMKCILPNRPNWHRCCCAEPVCRKVWQDVK